MGPAVILLQETHSNISCIHNWKQQRGGEIFFSHGTSSQAGVCILFPNNATIDLKPEIIFSDPYGRILLISINISGKLFYLCNVYAPTQQKQANQLSFIQDLANLLIEYENKNICIGGDWNAVLNIKLDKKVELQQPRFLIMSTKLKYYKKI